jgi:hypothetical protein
VSKVANESKYFSSEGAAANAIVPKNKKYDTIIIIYNYVTICNIIYIII